MCTMLRKVSHQCESLCMTATDQLRMYALSLEFTRILDCLLPSYDTHAYRTITRPLRGLTITAHALRLLTTVLHIVREADGLISTGLLLRRSCSCRIQANGMLGSHTC